MVSHSPQVWETSTFTGTGNVTSLAEVIKSFNDAYGTGGSDVFKYFIRNRAAPGEWEEGTGHLSDATTLVRDTVIRSSNSDAAVNFSAGTKDITSDFSHDEIVGKETIWIPASAMIPATTSGAARAQIEESTNKQNYAVYDFDDAADEYVQFQIAFPKGWDEGTITFQVWWSTTATDTDGVAWGLQGVALSDGDAIDASWGTAVVVQDDAQSAANDLLVTAESTAVTIAGTPAAGDLCFFRLLRDVSDANDDMTEDARLIGIKLFYTLDAGTDA